MLRRGGTPKIARKDNAFSYIRTEFGALRSRRLAVKHVGD